MFKQKAFRSLVGLLLFSVLLGSNLVAQAHAQDARAPQPGNGPHCIAQIDPVAPGQTASKVSNPACFATFSEAITAATAGTVRLSSNVKPADLTEDMLSVSTIRTVIGVDYKAPYYISAFGTFTWYTTVGGCTSTRWFYVLSMPYGWDNVVSSARSYSGCGRYYHFQYTSFRGTYIVCPCSSMGYMDNRTSSEKWFR